MTDNKEREAFEAWAIKRLNKHGLPYFLFAKRDGEYMDGGAQHAWDGWQARAALALSQSSEEAVRDEAYETAANKATCFLVGDPLAGIPLRNPMTHEIADAIRALKSAPPQPRKTFEEWLGEVVADGGCTVEALLVGDTDPIRCARSAWDACVASLYAAPVAAPAVLTDEQSDALIRLEDDLGCPRHNPSKVTVFADDLRTIIALARAQGEQAAPGEAVAFATYRQREDENDGKEYFYCALWHGETKLDAGERMVRGRFIPDAAQGAQGEQA